MASERDEGYGCSLLKLIVILLCFPKDCNKFCHQTIQISQLIQTHV